MPGGIAVLDFDNDGFLDIVVTTQDATESMAYYKNKGDGTFEDRTEAAGLKGQLGGLYCVQTDYNNDGRLDIFVMHGGWEMPMRNSLLRLQPMPTVYKGPAPGHGGFFKWDDDAHRSPKLALFGNVFRVDQLPNHGSLGLPDGYSVTCANNTIVWLGHGAFPEAASWLATNTYRTNLQGTATTPALASTPRLTKPRASGGETWSNAMSIGSRPLVRSSGISSSEMGT
jgi:hypothetical protein